MAHICEPAVTPVSAPLVASHLQQLRQHSPLTHVITNEVVVGFSANVLLALGATPAMIIDPEEAAEFQAAADALSVNVGTLSRTQQDTILSAVRAANRHNKPWILDPVAVGGLSLRTRLCRELLALGPTAIRGNGSEILALAGQRAEGRGPDSCATSDHALDAARQLARETRCVVAITGEIDYITDGEQILSVPAGSPLLTKITGTGCALSSVAGAFLALPDSPLLTVASACAVMAVAGQHAAATSPGPGSLAVALLDQLHQLSPETLARYL